MVDEQWQSKYPRGVTVGNYAEVPGMGWDSPEAAELAAQDLAKFLARCPQFADDYEDPGVEAGA